MDYFTGKIIGSLFLLISLSFMVFEITEAWQSSEIPVAQRIQKEKSTSEPQKKPQTIHFYPAVPASLPNLYEGYLFNRERSLADPAKYPEEIPENTEDQVSLEFDQLRYNGSIIIGDIAKALVTYPEPTKISDYQRVASRQKSSKRKQRRIKKNTMVKKTVEPGDSIGGYLVKNIHPHKIVFQRGGEHLEKMLYDPDKKRIILPARKSPSRRIVRQKKTGKTQKRYVPRPKQAGKNRRIVRRPRVVQRSPNSVHR